MNNLRGAKIIYQESKATQPSHLYFLQKDENYCEAIVTSESGAKRKLNINVDLSNYYTKTEVNTLINNIDLSNYYTKNEVDVKLLDYYTKVEINSQFSNYYTKNEVDTALATKQNNLGFTPENIANKSDSYTSSSSTTYASSKALVDGLATKLDKGTYTGTAQSLKNEIDNKQKLLSSFDESILIENNGNIEGNVSLFEEYFEQQECELNFTPIQIVAIYQDGIKLSNSEYEIILPKKIKIKEYVDENIQIEYTHLKS
jgi:hypothetical protein